MTPAPSSSSEATPPGLSVTVNNSANSESVAALAAVLRDVLSPAERRGLRHSPDLLGMLFDRNSLCSLHVIKPNSCPWS